jgi:hypothetical protein
VRCFNTIKETCDVLSRCDREGIEMDIPAYRIHQILRVCTGFMKINRIHASEKTISPSDFHDEVKLSSDGKKKQLIDRLVSEAVVQLAMRVRSRVERKIVDDIPHDIFLEDAKRKRYGTLM